MVARQGRGAIPPAEGQHCTGNTSRLLHPKTVGLPDAVRRRQVLPTGGRGQAYGDSPLTADLPRFSGER